MKRLGKVGNVVTNLSHSNFMLYLPLNGVD